MMMQGNRRRGGRGSQSHSSQGARAVRHDERLALRDGVLAVVEGVRRLLGAHGGQLLDDHYRRHRHVPVRPDGGHGNHRRRRRRPVDRHHRDGLGEDGARREGGRGPEGEDVLGGHFCLVRSFVCLFVCLFLVVSFSRVGKLG